MLGTLAQTKKNLNKKVDSFRLAEKLVVRTNTENLKSTKFQRNMLLKPNNNSKQEVTTGLQNPASDKTNQMKNHIKMGFRRDPPIIKNSNLSKVGLSSKAKQVLNPYTNKSKASLYKVQPRKVSPRPSLSFNSLKYLFPDQRKKKSYTNVSAALKPQYAHKQSSDGPQKENDNIPDLKENQTNPMPSIDATKQYDEKNHKAQVISVGEGEIETPRVSVKADQERTNITLTRDLERFKTSCLFCIPPAMSGDEMKKNSALLEKTNACKENTLKDINVQIIDFTHIFKRPSKIEILFGDSGPGTFFFHR
ncbi:uncharacterized protein LOC128884058 isoform X2 [Hylaeus volcanicus]|uniref:uncharacterized protein LOC128884058 isoform X2 n=1 Tax=Hylaeus volcanicus TaxID=313075 RepID=UPI0023B83528|nr:uncharacterized protein LOC128884058 isoform X2 [Hylaeus volcanicus]